jgi:hypothetical protein
MARNATQDSVLPGGRWWVAFNESRSQVDSSKTETESRKPVACLLNVVSGTVGTSAIGNEANFRLLGDDVVVAK